MRNEILQNLLLLKLNEKLTWLEQIETQQSLDILQLKETEILINSMLF